LNARRELAPTIESSAVLHDEILSLWEGVPAPATRRGFVAAGFCLVARQHVLGQFHLAAVGLDVSATTLVRPTFEALVRAVWVLKGADDEWVEGFTSVSDAAVNSDGETLKGPPVDSMLATIKLHHPANVADALNLLKDATWRAMHSYVHGGIRPVAQVMAEVPEHEVAGMLMNANTMLGMATNVFRLSCGVPSPELTDLWRRHARCFPPPASG
jgi:hypothetical protein